MTGRAMELLRYEAPGRNADRVLMVMLPGVGIEAADFAAQGFVGAAEELAAPLDIVAARPELDLYLDGTVAEEIHRAILAPLAPRRRVWFLGISLGGMGALLHARAYPESVEGIILLSPFLGSPGIIAEVDGAGGLGVWQPGDVAANDSERQLLAWLTAYLAAPPLRPLLYLGYGKRDRFVRGHALLGDRLPAGRVAVSEGGHDWPTWIELWRGILALDPLQLAPPRR